MAKYPDLKSYLQANYIELFTSEIQKFVDGNYDGNGFHSINVLSLLKHKIENVEVKALNCHDDIGPRVKMDVGLSADIVDMGLGTKEYEADRKTRWFKVFIQGNLIDGFRDVEVIDTKEYFGTFDKDNALDQFLLPYIYKADLEDQADDFTLFYCNDAIYDGYRLPIDYILRAFEIDCYTADLPEDCFGRMYFKESTATVYEKDYMIARMQSIKKEKFPKEGDEYKLGPGEYRIENKKINPGTILLSRQKFFLGNYGTHRLTFAHEIVHWYLHRKYFRLLALLDNDADQMSCDVEPTYFNEDMTLAQKAHWFAEWQANALAIRIAMPQSLVVQAFREARAAAHPYKYTGEFIEDMIDRVAELFDVPKYAVKQRARQLDWDAVDGAYVYVDGKHYPAFFFTEGILDYNQSFVISKNGYQQLYENDADFAELINSGEYLYLGYVVCKNDPKYITVDFTFREAQLLLSDYAREHADECCLIFNWKSTSQLKDEYEFYGQAYLSQQVSAAHSIEYTYDKDFNDTYKQSMDEIKEAAAQYNAALDEENKVKVEMLQKGINTFADAIIYHMDRKHITVEQLAERAELSDKTIKDYRAGNKKPPIENVMAVCIGLNLPKAYSLHLLSTQSYTLGDTQRDRAYRMCLDYSDGTIQQWNMILDAFNQPHIPDKRNQKTK